MSHLLQGDDMKDTENHMVLDGYIDEPEVDEDLCYELVRQEAIDEAIEAGDWLLDSRKEDSLVNALEDIALTASPKQPSNPDYMKKWDEVGNRYGKN